MAYLSQHDFERGMHAVDETSNLLLPYILAAQAQKHVTHNEALRRLDALVQISVVDRDLAAPPASPGDGERYIVAAAPTGNWSGHAGKIAAWQDGAWAIYEPRPGWLVWIEDDEAAVAWNGADWVAVGGASVNPVPLVGVNATADTTNRLAVSSPASLFNHDGTGHQAKINKNAAGDTASLLFQTGYSGRAEMGTTGDDDFHFKVSPDGTAWHDAIVIDRQTGAVSLPNSAITADPKRWRVERDPGQGWQTHYNASSTGSVATAMVVPVVVGKAGNHDRLTCFCHTAAAGATLRIAFYASAADNGPGVLLADFGTAALDTGGYKTLQLGAPIWLESGIYWVLHQASSTAPAFRGATFAQPTGSGSINSTIVGEATTARIVYLGFAAAFPADMSAFTLGTGGNQMQFLPLFTASFLLR